MIQFKSIVRTNCAIFCLMIAGLASSPAFGQSLPLANEPDSDWRFTITPYAFLPVSTQGSSTVAGSTVDLDLDFSEALELLDFALSVRGEAWKGKWGIISDFYIVELEIDSSVGLPGPGGGSADIDVNIDQKWVSLLGAYRFAEGSTGKGLRYAWDVSGGVRWNSIEQQVDASVAIGPGGQTSLGGTEDWLEPMLGIRLTYEISERWTLAGRAEFGGFGVGGDDLQYTLLVGADWRVWETTSLKSLS